MPTPGPIILFDGVCGLCDRFVQFVLKTDKNGIFRFSPLQGETASSVLARKGLKDEALKSVILVEGEDDAERLLFQSDAALRIFRRLGGVWSLLGLAGMLIPRFIRDAVYRIVARNRYRWFGKFDACRRPPTGWEERFLP